jgi:hypothetical protein
MWFAGRKGKVCMDIFIRILMGAGQCSEGSGWALNVTHGVCLLVVTGLLRNFITPNEAKGLGVWGLLKGCILRT